MQQSFPERHCFPVYGGIRFSGTFGWMSVSSDPPWKPWFYIRTSCRIFSGGNKVDISAVNSLQQNNLRSCSFCVCLQTHNRCKQSHNTKLPQ